MIASLDVLGMDPWEGSEKKSCPLRDFTWKSELSDIHTGVGDSDQKEEFKDLVKEIDENLNKPCTSADRDRFVNTYVENFIALTKSGKNSPKKDNTLLKANSLPSLEKSESDSLKQKALNFFNLFRSDKSINKLD